MTTTTKNYLSITTLLIFFILAVASSASNHSYSDADKWIPSDFDPSKTTLLIETHPLSKHQNDRMIDYIKKNYPYPFVVVDKNVIDDKNGEYADTKKYQFALLWESVVSTNTSISGGSVSESHPWDMYGNFLDRSTNKLYPSTNKSNVYGQVGYRPVINSIVGKFKTKK